MTALTRKKQKSNPFLNYFRNFGLKQVADIALLAASITIIVGLCVDTKFTGMNIVTLIGGCVWLAAMLINLFLIVKVLIKEKNHRAPQYKQAFVNVFIVVGLIALNIAFIVFSINPLR